MKRIVFVMPNLREGGAEKVLVNLANHLDKSKFDVSIATLFAEGVNIQFLKPEVHYRGKFPKVFRGNKCLMKLFTPEQLYKTVVGKEYDVVIAYLEGPATRIVAGCPYKKSKLVAWVHGEQHTMKQAADSFRSEKEALQCYKKYNKVVAVSNTVKEDFQSIFHLHDVPVEVLYNTNESEKILAGAKEPVDEGVFRQGEIKLISVGRLKPEKGFDRLARVHLKLRQAGYLVHTYILGIGPQKSEIEKFIKENKLSDSFTFLGYDTNPYKYVSKSDLFVCSSLREGFSTAATEALIVGTPVCTVEVSGMKEMLGKNNEYGVITENNEDALFEGIKELLDSPDTLAHYRKKAEERGRSFSTDVTVKAVEKMLEELCE